MTHEQLKEKYPEAEFMPTPNCRICGGTGEEFQEGNETFAPGYVPCPCLFFGPDMDELAGALSETVKRIVFSEDPKK